MTETIYYAIRKCEHKDGNYTWSNADATADAATHGAKSPIDALLSWDTVDPIIITFCFTVCEPSVLTDNTNIYFLEINGIKLCVLLDQHYNKFNDNPTKYALVDIKNAFQQNATATTATTATVTADELKNTIKTSIEEHLSNNKNVTQEELQNLVKNSIANYLNSNQNVTQEGLQDLVKNSIANYLNSNQNVTQEGLQDLVKNGIENYLNNNVNVTQTDLQSRIKLEIKYYLDRQNITHEQLEDKVKEEIELYLGNGQNITHEQLENKVKEEIELYLLDQQISAQVNALSPSQQGNGKSGGSKSNLRSPYNFTKLARNEKNKNVYYVYV